MYCKILSYSHVYTLKCPYDVTVENRAYDDTKFFTQNDSSNYILKFDTPYEQHAICS